ncbi:MAG TPA: phosphonate ABC transporter ATP-binding protein [Anaerolineae bacterium]|nr:phosphonate ABC transporter ATP-binding protein [Anaerolineae bacterium]
MLEIKNLSKIYDDGTKALNNVSLTVQNGEFVVVIGLSGSGKSTLLRCINRLIEPTSGQIIFNGVDITAASSSQLRRIRRDIAMIFQQFNLVRRASVMRNVMSGRLGYMNPWSSLVGLYTKEDRERARRALETVGITDKANNRADALSGGQQQRVGIARALMQEPKILLADEPVSALDPATSHSVMKYLELINRRDKVTVLCSLHFLSLARTYASRIIALKDGIMMFDGLPGEIDETRFREIYGEEAVEVQIT